MNFWHYNDVVLQQFFMKKKKLRCMLNCNLLLHNFCYIMWSMICKINRKLHVLDTLTTCSTAYPQETADVQKITAQ